MARIDLQRSVSCNFPSSWQELSRTLKKGEMNTSEMGSSRFGHDQLATTIKWKEYIVQVSAYQYPIYKTYNDV